MAEPVTFEELLAEINARANSTDVPRLLKAVTILRRAAKTVPRMFAIGHSQAEVETYLDDRIQLCERWLTGELP